MLKLISTITDAKTILFRHNFVTCGICTRDANDQSTDTTECLLSSHYVLQLQVSNEGLRLALN